MFKLDTIFTWGGGTASLLGILACFRIDGISFWNALGDMNGRTVFLTGSLLILAVGLFLKWRETKVTPRNVQHKIRQWLDTFNLSHRVHNFAPWHFTLVVTFNDLPMFIGRPKILAGRYILIQARIRGVIEENMSAFERLSQSERSQFYRELALETARARISFNWEDLTNITINRYIPITDRLSESEVIETLNDIYLSAVVIWNTTALRLSESPRLTQPPLAPAPTLPSGPTGPTGPLQIRDTEERRKHDAWEKEQAESGTMIHLPRESEKRRNTPPS